MQEKTDIVSCTLSHSTRPSGSQEGGSEGLGMLSTSQWSE